MQTQHKAVKEEVDKVRPSLVPRGGNNSTDGVGVGDIAGGGDCVGGDGGNSDDGDDASSGDDGDDGSSDGGEDDGGGDHDCGGDDPGKHDDNPLDIDLSGFYDLALRDRNLLLDVLDNDL